MFARYTLSTFLALVFSPLASHGAQHPLDPLTWQEYWTVLEVLKEADHLDDKTRFSMITLKEPSKDLVWRWTDEDSVPRSAFAVVRQEEKTFEAAIDLVARTLNTWTEIDGVQPTWLVEEFSAMKKEITAHPDVISALARRDIDDFTFLNIAAVPLGYFGAPEEAGRRIAHVTFTDARDVRNSWLRGIQGLTVVVDVETKEVLRVVDEGVVPLASTSADFDLNALGDPRELPGPITVQQPLGTGFTLDGYQVEWQKWRFHVRPDQRVGMVISTVTYQDGEEIRPILYQGFMSEMFVPYMDPATPWYARNFIDAGEFSAGGMASPMVEGQDGPRNAVYIDSLIAGDNGRPTSKPRTISIFERASGDMSWRHWEAAGAGGPESRAKRDLVVRSIAVVGNYDYVFDWIFQQDGSIRIAVGATGIVESKMVAEENASSARVNGESGGRDRQLASASDAYGRFVDRHIVAVNHDHYFSFYLDLDVDGTENNLVIDRLTAMELPDDHPRRSIWVNRPFLARKELDAQLSIDFNRPALWRVLNTSKSNKSGYPTSYQLLPGRNANTLLSSDDYPRLRAGFIDHHLWVTPYQPDERYAAGDYPTLSEPGYGLPKWTSENRAIEKTDIVLWHTVGMHHMVRAEDWPVMPVMWHEFELRPFDFFDQNPALDLPLK